MSLSRPRAGEGLRRRVEAEVAALRPSRAEPSRDRRTGFQCVKASASFRLPPSDRRPGRRKELYREHH